MKEDLISFETAKEAKNKGFDEKCEFGYYNFEEGHRLNGKLRDFNHAYSTGKPMSKNSELDCCVTAPIQSLLQKWLREVHNIHCDVQLMLGSNLTIRTKGWEKIYTCYIYTFNEDGRLNQDLQPIFNIPSYEECLEQGLIQSLKLIKQ